MAKRKGRRKFRRYLKGMVNLDLATSAMASKTLSSDTVVDVLTESAYLTSVKATWSMGEFAPLAETGPILVGVAHSDYSNTELEEWIENTQSWNQGDMIAQEKNRRAIRIVGTFKNPEVVTDTAWLNDGKPVRTKCGWQLLTGQTLRVWAYNLGDQSLSQGVKVNIYGHANLWPN